MGPRRVSEVTAPGRFDEKALGRLALALCHANVGPGEVLADEEQRLVCEPRRCIGETIAEVEAGMPAAAESPIAIHRLSPMVVAEVQHRDIEVAQEAIHDRLGFHPQACLEDDAGFGEGGRSDTNYFGAPQLVEEPLESALTENDGDDRRGVEDQTPGLP